MSYRNLAQIYDSIMAYVPYHNWVNMIEDIRKRYFDHKPKIFEIGGGTGTLGSMLVYEEYNYVGSDITPEMATEAWSKGLDYIIADCRYLPLKDKYEMIIFLFDGINYLKILSDYEKTFHEVWNSLDEEGLFFFDITTEYNSIHNFSDYYEAEAFENGAYIRNSFYDKESREQYNVFDIFIESLDNEGCYRRFNEKHTQHLFSVEEVISVIPLDLFSIEGVWQDFTEIPYTEKSERVHFLLRRKEQV